MAPVHFVNFNIRTPMDTKPIEAKICQRMKELRNQHGLTQEDFEVQISSRHIRDIELLNKTNIELSTILKFCYVLRIHPRDIFDVKVPWIKES